MAQRAKLTTAGKIVIVLFVLACIGGAYYLFMSDRQPDPHPSQVSQPAPAQTQPPPGEVTIGVAYGTEKERWLKWAIKEFADTDAGKAISVNLIPMGSQEGAKAILGGDERIHVWSPAGALYKDIFVQEWQVKHGTDPVIAEENLVLTPMVFVLWDERYQAFVDKYGQVSFDTLAQALKEKGGWDAIAGKPEWGLFKFGHTNPNQSNSGLVTLILSAYDYHGKSNDLVLKDILDVGYQTWMQDFERGVGGLLHSTGTMMKDMVLKGPSAYDALVVYESVAIDYLKNAEGRWGTLRVVYPEKNMWNENPYYIVDVPWSSDEHRGAARSLMKFLMTERIQAQSLVHGFRPGNPAVPINDPDSPFSKYKQYGLKIDLASVCEPPKAEVINNLLASWLRNQRAR